MDVGPGSYLPQSQLDACAHLLFTPAWGSPDTQHHGTTQVQQGTTQVGGLLLAAGGRPSRDVLKKRQFMGTIANHGGVVRMGTIANHGGVVRSPTTVGL